MKKLAVLLPAYNAALYIKASIDSILNQTFHDFDLYIYDDCSTDNTAEIISSYNNSRIFYSKNVANLGIAKTLNKGLDELLEMIRANIFADYKICRMLILKLSGNLISHTEFPCKSNSYFMKHTQLN